MFIIFGKMYSFTGEQEDIGFLEGSEEVKYMEGFLLVEGAKEIIKHRGSQQLKKQAMDLGKSTLLAYHSHKEALVAALLAEALEWKESIENLEMDIGEFMQRLSDLPNIGKTMEKRLTSVGINDVETLMKTGSKEAFIKLRLHEGDTCFSSLCGLEGAIQGIRWHNLNSETKGGLKKFFDSFKKNCEEKLG